MIKNFNNNSIEHKKWKNLSLISGLYDDKLLLLQDILADFEKNKGNPDFDFNVHYQTEYAPKFAAIGGKISGNVRNFKNHLMMEILVCMKSNYSTMNFFTLKMYEKYSKEVFGASPTNKVLIALLNDSIDLKQKLIDKKEEFGHSHISKLSWSNILGDGVNDEIKNMFDMYYGEFIQERKKLKMRIKDKENAVKLILKSSKDNEETKKEE